MNLMTQAAGQQFQRGNLVGACAAGTESRPLSELEAENHQLGDAINDLAIVAGELVARLAPLQMPANLGSGTDKAAGAPVAVLSPFAEELRAKRCGVNEITRQLRVALASLAI